MVFDNIVLQLVRVIKNLIQPDDHSGRNIIGSLVLRCYAS